MTGSVAGQALSVVIRLVVTGGLVGVVAGEAADALVVADEALAVFKAVGLKADEGRALPVVADYSFPGAMTLAAEGGDLLGVEAAK